MTSQRGLIDEIKAYVRQHWRIIAALVVGVLAEKFCQSIRRKIQILIRHGLLDLLDNAVEAFSSFT